TRRRAIGNAVSTVSVSDVVGKSNVSNVTEVLQSKVPGLTLMPGSGEAGTSTNYRLRGAGSLYAGNNPTIYVDGVRVNSRGQGNSTVFGQNPSSLDAINPNDIESIEVIKGPAAATLSGAEAAAGVIQIITKKGQPGRIRWDARWEAGHSWWPESMRPINFAVATAARIADPVNYPGFVGTQVGDIVSHRVMSESDALRNGGIMRSSLSASGGGDRYSFFVSGARAEYKSLSWFSNRLRVGLDMNIGRAELYFRPQPSGLDPFSARASFDLVNTKGFIAEGRPLNQDFTINYDGTVTRELTSSLV